MEVRMPASHLLILVHGMGSPGKDWADEYASQLRKSYQLIPSLNRVPFDDAIAVKGIVYDTFFEERRVAWKDNAAKVLQGFVDAGMSKGGAAAVMRATGSMTTKQFLSTHVLDVLHYRFLRTVGEQVRSYVSGEIERLVQAHDPVRRPPYSILAHSLGTAVVTESLHCWISEEIDGLQAWDSRLGPNNLFMVANCARLLWSLGPKNDSRAIYKSATWPYPTPELGACRYYGNYSHALDPVTHAQPFDRPDEAFYHWPDRSEIYGNVDIHPEDVQRFNVHGLDHYLAHPNVYVDLFRRIRGLTLVSENECHSALDRYGKTTLTGKALADVRVNLTKYTSGDTETLNGVVERLLQYLRDLLDE
jgi:hypothetical protein